MRLQAKVATFSMMLIVIVMSMLACSSDTSSVPTEARIEKDLNIDLVKTSYGALQVHNLKIKSQNKISEKFIAYNVMVTYRLNEKAYKSLKTNNSLFVDYRQKLLRTLRRKNGKKTIMTTYYKRKLSGPWKLSWSKEGEHY